MGIEDLNLPKSWVSDNDACGCLAHKPVSAENVKGRPVQGIWVYSSRDNWKPCEYNQTCTKGTAAAEIVRGAVRGQCLYGYAPVEEL
jgi:hypothetical protein